MLPLLRLASERSIHLVRLTQGSLTPPPRSPRSNQLVLSNALVDNLAMAEDRAQIGLHGQTNIMAAFMGVEAGL